MEKYTLSCRNFVCTSIWSSIIDFTTKIHWWHRSTWTSLIRFQCFLKIIFNVVTLRLWRPFGCIRPYIFPAATIVICYDRLDNFNFFSKQNILLIFETILVKMRHNAKTQVAKQNLQQKQHKKAEESKIITVVSTLWSNYYYIHLYFFRTQMHIFLRHYRIISIWLIFCFV